MPSLTASGIGSGLDVDSIVTQLMEIEKVPLTRNTSQQTDIKAQISAFGQYKSALSSFQTAMNGLNSLAKFKVFAGASSDEAVLGVEAGSSAGSGTYDIEVTSLASHHKLATNAFTSSADQVGTGTLTIQVGAESFDVVIDGTNNTLAGIRDAINNSGENTGVSAALLSGDDGVRLMLTSDESGTANALTVSGSSGLSAFNGLNEVTAAADAVLRIDDFVTVTSSSNTVADAIQGVTLNLKSIGGSTISLERDDAAITANMQAFADAYNGLIDTTNSLRNGQLAGDGTLLTVQSSILSVINTPASITGGAFSFLTEVGLSIGRDGKMSVDSTRMNQAMQSDFQGFANVLGNDTEGFAARLSGMIDGFLDSDGIIDSREDGFNTRLRRLEDQQANLEYRLQIKEERIRSQFAALDTLVSKMNSTGSYLSQYLTTL